MTHVIRTLIADDEPLAREILQQMLGAHPEMEVVGESGSGAAAVRDIRRLRPDLVLLDIHMPEMNGFEVLRALEPDPLPQIIFVTAHDTYALRAFEVHALDYLLKPFDEQRLAAALARAQARNTAAEQAATARRVIELLEAMQSRSRWAERLPVKAGARTLLLPVESIDFIEAHGKFVHITADGARHVIREKLYQVADMLNPEQFLRISRSAIVNVASIEEILPWARGEYMLVLRSGVRVQSTRAYRDSLTRLLELQD